MARWSHLGPVLVHPWSSTPVQPGLTAGELWGRGLPADSSLPPVHPRQILAGAKAHKQRTGRWPHEKSGPVMEAPRETWAGVNAALREGLRGLPGGTTLFRRLRRGRTAR